MVKIGVSSKPKARASDVRRREVPGVKLYKVIWFNNKDDAFDSLYRLSSHIPDDREWKRAPKEDVYKFAQLVAIRPVEERVARERMKYARYGARRA